MTLLRTRSVRPNAVISAAALCLTLAAGLVAAPSGLAGTVEDLCGPLSAVAAQAQRGQVTAAAAQAAGLSVDANGVQVEIFFESEAARRAANLAQYGVQVQVARDRRIQAAVPANQLANVAQLPGVTTVRPPFPPILLQGTGAVISQGVQLTNALSFQLFSSNGSGVKTAVIDGGFLGYTAAELPPNVQAMSFRADFIIDGITEHGTACAEVVADMAPGAELYLLAVGTSMETENAYDWCAANGIQVTSMSLAFAEGPYDGTSALDRTVTKTRRTGNGILCAVAAGNHAQRHWMGDYSDRNKNGIVEFKGSDETLSLGSLAAGDVVDASLSWYQTASPTGTRADVTDRDYDLVLVAEATQRPVARSAYTQNGNDPPSERLFAIIPSGGTYALQIWGVSPNIAVGPVDNFQLFLAYLDIMEVSLRVPETSVLMPATGPQAFSVGATRADANLAAIDPTITDYPVDTLEEFSSWGPTVDGQAKPQLSGPDGVFTTLATLPIFFGTSAACPHVAGAAALLLGEDPSRTATEVENVLVRLATEQNGRFPVTLVDGRTKADQFQCGAGRLTLRAGLDTSPPSIFISFPESGKTVTTTTPTVVATILDRESGVDVSSIELTIDGEITPYDSYVPSSGVLTYTPPSPLSRAAHTITLKASDTAGNEAEPEVVNFRISLPTLGAWVHLITLPYRNLATMDPGAIFGASTSDIGLVRWVATDQAFNKYRVYPDPLASFAPPDAFGPTPTVDSPPAGLGYFASLPHEVTVSPSGETLADVTSYRIRLWYGTVPPQGWNLIGDPFLESIDFASAQFITKGRRLDLDAAIEEEITEGILYEYVPGTATQSPHYRFTDPMAGVLGSGQGYWIHVNQDTILELYPSAVSAAAVTRRGDRPVAPTQAEARGMAWQAQITARADELVDVCNYIGVSNAATEGYDSRGDLPEPPWLPEGVRVYFPHDDWGPRSGNYTQDVMPAGPNPTWAMEVSCSRPGAEVRLHWPNLNETVPADVRLVLRDLDNARTVSMRNAETYSFRAGAESRHLEVQALSGRRGVMVTTMTATATPAGAVVAYELHEPASITVEVRNIAGRPVKRLRTNELALAGQNTETWDLTNDAGVHVPPGCYLVSLMARAEDGYATSQIRLLNIRP